MRWRLEHQSTSTVHILCPTTCSITRSPAPLPHLLRTMDRFGIQHRTTAHEHIDAMMSATMRRFRKVMLCVSIVSLFIFTWGHHG